MTKGLWALVGVGVLGSAGLAAWHAQDPPKIEPRGAPQKRSTGKRAEPTTPDVTRTWSDTPKAPVELPAPQPAASGGLDAPQPMTREQRAFELEQRFDQDLPPDARARGIGVNVRSELERVLGSDGQLRGVECKLKTCRASIAFVGLEEGKSVFRRVMAAGEGPFASFEMQMDHEVGADGHMDTVLFFYL